MRHDTPCLNLRPRSAGLVVRGGGWRLRAWRARDKNGALVTLLLDINVVSELRKREPDPNVLAWYAAVSSAELFLSVLTIGKIRLGIERLRRKDPAQAATIEQWLRGRHG